MKTKITDKFANSYTRKALPYEVARYAAAERFIQVADKNGQVIWLACDTIWKIEE